MNIKLINEVISWLDENSSHKHYVRIQQALSNLLDGRNLTHSESGYWGSVFSERKRLRGSDMKNIKRMVRGI